MLNFSPWYYHRATMETEQFTCITMADDLSEYILLYDNSQRKYFS